MNGEKLQRLIYKGYALEAKITGYDYDVYRSSSPMNPTAASKLVTTLKCSFWADEKAAVANKYQTPTWLLRADGNQLERFDFLIGPFGTFFVASKQPTLPMEAILCNNVVDIYHIDYSSGVPLQNIYAQGLPIFKQYRREDIRRDATGLEIGNATTHWRAFIPLQNHVLKQGDIITDEEGISYTMDAPDFTSVGYAANMRLASA